MLPRCRDRGGEYLRTFGRVCVYVCMPVVADQDDANEEEGGVYAGLRWTPIEENVFLLLVIESFVCGYIHAAVYLSLHVHSFL